VVAASAAVLGAADAWAQSAPTPVEAELPPLVVEPPAKKKAAAKKKGAPAVAATPVASPAPSPAPADSTAESSASPLYADPGPGVNLDVPNTTGSRLGITPLETPASVSVISGQTARERGQNTITEAVTQNAPGITTVAPPIFGSAFAARGFMGNNSVMQLYDGTRLFPGRGNITFPFNTWSVERIEVLHGPASVLQGDGAIGGIINVIPKKPITTGMFNEAQVFFDSNLTRRLSVDSGGAVTKDVSYRLNASMDASDGWVDDGESENLGVSGAVRVQASDELVFSISHDYGDQEPMRYFGTPFRDGVAFDPRTKKNNYNVADSLITFRDSWTQFKTEWTPHAGLSVRNVAYRLDSRREFRNAENYFWDSGADLVFREGLHIRQKQEQIGNRLDATLRTEWLGTKNQTVVGFDINRGKFGIADYFTSAITPVDPLNPEPGNFPNPNLLNPNFDSTLDQKSLFLEHRLELNQYLALVGGARWDDFDLVRRDVRFPSLSVQKDMSAFNWRVGAVVTPLPGLALFGQYAEASDPPNVPLLDSDSNFRDFTLTRGRQAEIGIKQSLFNGALEWSLSTYRIVKNDMLIRNPVTSTLVQIGEQSSRGVEAVIGAELGGGWRIDANAAKLRARYDDFKDALFVADPCCSFDVVDYSGNVPALIPEEMANIWLTWAFAADWQASVGLQYVGKAYANFSNSIEIPSYTITNVGLQWRPTEFATLDFRVKNVFDELYLPYVRTDLQQEPGPTQGFVGAPRTFEAAMTVRF